MKNIFIKSFGFLILICSVAQAVDYGVGGNVILCPNGQNEVVAYYRDRILKNNPPDFGGAQSYREILEVLLKRLGRHFPLEEATARKELQVFETDKKYIENAEIVGQDDHLEVPLPNGCGIKKVIVENKKRFPEDKAYYVQKDYWLKLSPQTQAGLVFEFLLFKTTHPASENHQGAFWTLNASLAGAQSYPKLQTPKGWGDLVRETKLYYDLYDGKYPLDSSVKYWRNGQFHYVHTEQDQRFSIDLFGRKILVGGMENSGYFFGFSPNGVLTDFMPVRLKDLDFLHLRHKNIGRFHTDEKRSFYGYYVNPGSENDQENVTIDGGKCMDVSTFEYNLDGSLRGLSCGIFIQGPGWVAGFITFAWLNKSGKLEKVKVGAAVAADEDKIFVIPDAQGRKFSCDDEAIVLLNPNKTYRGFEEQAQHPRTPRCHPVK